MIKSRWFQRAWQQYYDGKAYTVYFNPATNPDYHRHYLGSRPNWEWV